MSELDVLQRKLIEGAASKRFAAPRRLDGPSLSPSDAGPTLRIAGAPVTAPPRRVLGISAFFHDAAAALVIDGEVVAAAHEERFSRRKHDPSFPRLAIDYCLAEASLKRHDVDVVAFYEEPFLQAERMIAAIAASMDPARTLRILTKARAVLDRQSSLPRALDWSGPLVFVQHHVAHAASAFYVSGFANAAFMVVDGVGEWATATLGTADQLGIRPIEQIDYPHSLGLFYAAITAHLGFRANEDEYKVMGLAPYGTPNHVESLRRLLRLHDDGGFSLDLEHMPAPLDDPSPDDTRLADLLGIAARTEGAPIEPAHADVARSAQQILEEALCALTLRLAEKTDAHDLVLAGGVALNGVATFKAFCSSVFERIFVQPAAGDAGGALGAALHAWHELGGRSAARSARAEFDPFLGPAFSSSEVGDFLRSERVHFELLGRDAMAARVATALARGRLVGWLQGRMEFGPRALGGRSILADPRQAAVRDTINLRIKMREGFRPFAPILPEEKARTFFTLPEGPLPAPLRYMLFVLPMNEDQRARVPAVVHVDGTARPQIVTRSASPGLHALLSAFERESGIALLLNTSFNMAGEPIVCTPEDAYRTYCYSGLDLLVMEDHLVERQT